MTARRLLLVEDEPSLARTLGDRLTAEGYNVEVAADGPAGQRAATGGGFDLVLLDVNLPGKNGFDVCRDLRREGVATPILMLTARNELVDRVLGLKLGADDYLAKPFETLELLARIEALMRRSRPKRRHRKRRPTQPTPTASATFASTSTAPRYGARAKTAPRPKSPAPRSSTACSGS